MHWSDVVCYAPSSSFGTRKALYVIVLCANSVPAMFKRVPGIVHWVQCPGMVWIYGEVVGRV